MISRKQEGEVNETYRIPKTFSKEASAEVSSAFNPIGLTYSQKERVLPLRLTGLTFQGFGPTTSTQLSHR